MLPLDSSYLGSYVAPLRRLIHAASVRLVALALVILLGLLAPVSTLQAAPTADPNKASPQALYAEQRFSGHNVNIGVRQRREGTGRGFRG